MCATNPKTPIAFQKAWSSLVLQLCVKDFVFPQKNTQSLADQHPLASTSCLLRAPVFQKDSLGGSHTFPAPDAAEGNAGMVW